jgi:hypothetical protein
MKNVRPSPHIDGVDETYVFTRIQSAPSSATTSTFTTGVAALPFPFPFPLSVLIASSLIVPSADPDSGVPPRSKLCHTPTTSAGARRTSAQTATRYGAFVLSAGRSEADGSARNYCVFDTVLCFSCDSGALCAQGEWGCAPSPAR